MKRLSAVLLAFAFASGAWADLRVVATTGWVAAFVRSAGFTGPIRVLAPFELQHPPEYELKPSDLLAVADADVLLYAGYERMASRLLDAVSSSTIRKLKITTDHGMKTIRESVMAIAGALGTSAKAQENLETIQAFIESWRRELAAAGWSSAAVLAHAMHKPLLEELGFRIVGVFGPAPLEATKIRDLSGLGARLIVDNVHNPVASPLRETVKDARYLALRNFPSSDISVLEILAENRRLMAATLGGGAR
jgi:zinc transport system substrate-binding protein